MEIILFWWDWTWNIGRIFINGAREGGNSYQIKTVWGKEKREEGRSGWLMMSMETSGPPKCQYTINWRGLATTCSAIIIIVLPELQVAMTYPHCLLTWWTEGSLRLGTDFALHTKLLAPRPVFCAYSGRPIDHRNSLKLIAMFDWT